MRKKNLNKMYLFFGLNPCCSLSTRAPAIVILILIVIQRTTLKNIVSENNNVTRMYIKE